MSIATILRAVFCAPRASKTFLTISLAAAAAVGLTAWAMTPAGQAAPRQAVVLSGNLTGLQHLGLPVADLKKSRAFYERLGFRQVMAAELPQAVDSILVAMMELNGFVIELYQLTGEDLKEIRSRKDGHIDHVALNVRDIDAAYRELKAAGIAPLEPAPVYLPFWEYGIRYFNVLGPDGERVEFASKKAKPETREIAVARRYLHFPVKNRAPKTKMTVSVGDTIVDAFDIGLVDGEPDFWVFLDVGRFKGKTATIVADRLPADSAALAAIRQDDAIPGADTLYKEKLRPQFHFTSRRGWNNDPNGLVFSKGEYHLYYQHNPYGWPWGNMHWGHAVSRDLVHWEELPTAIYPARYGDWVFSGSAVVDTANTAGFKTGAEDVIVAAFTSTGRGECIIYSNDRGRTFAEYAGNPVVKHAGRDPKLVWYAPGKHWVMAVYDEFEKKGWIAFYTSPDLKSWTFQSRLEGYYECPELFPLAVDGKKDDPRWIAYAADGAYAIGAFDGKVFTPESGKHRFNWGNMFYASQTFSNIPAADGRRIQIGWGTVDLKGMPFNQMMDFPVELTLRTTDEGIRMFAYPVREIERLYDKKYAWKGEALPEGKNLLAGITEELFDIRAEIEPAGAAEVGFVVRGTRVAYDAKAQSLLGKDPAPLKPEGGKIKLRILVDRASVEVFGNDGRVYMPCGAIHPEDNRTLELYAKGGEARVISLEVRTLRSAW